MYKTSYKGRNLAFRVIREDNGYLHVNAYATVKVPGSVREKALRGKDVIDNIIFCDIDTGCFKAPYHSVDQIIKDRPQEISNYFEEVLDKTYQAIAHPRFRYTDREATDYILNNATELKSQIKEEYKHLGVDMKQYAIDNNLINNIVSEMIEFMCQNHDRWAQGEPLSTTLARSEGKFQRPADKATADAGKTAAKTAYVGTKPVEKPAKEPEKKPDTLVKKPKKDAEKLDKIVATTTLPDNATAVNKPYLPSSTKPPAAGATNIAGEEHWYDKWWVWTIVGGVVAGAAATTAGVLLTQGGGKTSTGPDNFIMNYGDYKTVGGR
jgi:hypothetical protein